MPYGDPSDINPPPQQPPATGSNEPPPGWNAAQAAQQPGQQGSHGADREGEGSEQTNAQPPATTNTGNIAAGTETQQQNLLYQWSHPVQGPDMPTPTVFRNGRTEHSDVVVEGVIVQRAFFSNPPSEAGGDRAAGDDEQCIESPSSEVLRNLIRQHHFDFH